MENRFEDLKTVVKKFDSTLANSLTSDIPLKDVTHTTSSKDDYRTEDSSSSHIIHIKSSNPVNVLDDFTAKSNTLRNYFDKIHKNNHFIGELKLKSLQTSEAEVEKELNVNLEKAVDENNLDISKAKILLEEIQNENEKMSNDNDFHAHTQIRRNLTMGLGGEFRRALIEFQNVQNDFKDQSQNKIRRQIKIVYPEAQENEVEEFVENGSPALLQAVMSKMTNQSLKNAVADISEKYRAIQKLEKSALELNRLFIDLATILEHQDEMLDDIATQVREIKQYVHQGRGELVKARKYQIATKKRMIWFVAILAIVVAVIIIVLLFV